MKPDFTSFKKRLLSEVGRPSFWSLLKEATSTCEEFSEIATLNTLRKKSLSDTPQMAPLTLAIVGGAQLKPFDDFLEHFLAISGFKANFIRGSFDNYRSEILEENEFLNHQNMSIVFIHPSDRNLTIPLTLSNSEARERAESVIEEILQLCKAAHQRTGAEIILSNFILPASIDPGSYRTRTLSSEWNFRKYVNLELGIRAPQYVHICDLEFLSCRLGLTLARDPRSWFESKQPCAPKLLVEYAREAAHQISQLKKVPKKVLVLDMDNTLYGGVIGDDGLKGIDLGDTSARGEAFKAFQKAILSLLERGTILAISSKNDMKNALDVLENHPEMILRKEHFVSIKANWDPKPDNIKAIARELNLGLDSFVFIDDNPAEIDAVRQFLPEVETILLTEDPADYVSQLKNSRHFEPKAITHEDKLKTKQYQMRALSEADSNQITNMDVYLKSLEMKCTFTEFQAVDVPRIAQLINKSNQFNLTTKRRTESEVENLLNNLKYVCFTVRLSDKFGDHGLISIVILEKSRTPNNDAMHLNIDTWLMSCRVLKRGVEEEVCNEIVRIAKSLSANFINGIYIPSEKNQMVVDLLPRLGFQIDGNHTYSIDCSKLVPSHQTHISIARTTYESN